MSGRQSIGSYGILALHSALLKKNSEFHVGLVGVNDFSPPPYQSDGVEFVVGIGSRTDEDVRLTGPQVKVKSNAMIDGLLAYHDLVSVGSGVVIGQEAQLAVPNWPLFTEAELPEFVSGVPGTAVIDVSQGGTESLTPGAYDLVKVRKNGSLTLEAGEYSIREFDAGDFTTTYFEGPTQLLVKERFQVSKQSVFGPDPQSQISATDILVYVEGINGINGNVGSTPKAAKIGLGARLQAQRVCAERYRLPAAELEQHGCLHRQVGDRRYRCRGHRTERLDIRSGEQEPCPYTERSSGKDESEAGPAAWQLPESEQPGHSDTLLGQSAHLGAPDHLQRLGAEGGYPHGRRRRVGSAPGAMGRC